MDAHEDVLYHRNDGKVSAVGSSRSRPASQTAHHFHHKLAWKAINIDTKHVIFRCDGICKDDPKYNVHTLSDPRNPLTRFRNVESIDLSLPSFVLDNNSVGPQPKREVSIFGLNDNINHAFLSNMCQKTGQIIEIFVYMHPRTKKHLGMAYVVFQDVGKADSFVAKNNGTSVMGQTITCIVDPYAKEISRRYEEQTIEVAPIPHYLSRLDHNKLIEFRRTNFKNILISLSPSANAQQSTGFKAQESASQKQLDESEAAFNHDNQQMQQSVEPVLTKKVQTENVIPLNEHSTIPLIAENFSPPAASPITNFPCPPLITAQAGHRTVCYHHFMSHQHSQAYNHSIPSSPVSPVSNFPSISPSAGIFLPLSLLPPVTGRMPFTTWSNVPPPPLRTPAPNTWPRSKTIFSTLVAPQVLSVKNSAPTILNFVSTAYQTVPSTSSCEETTPMDPAPSEQESKERKKPKTNIPNTQRRKRSVSANGKVKIRKRRRLRESISVSSGSSSSGNNETNELSEDSSRSSSSTVKRKHRHRKKGIVKECKYYKKKGLDGTNDYYKEIVIRKNDNIRRCSHETKSDLLQSPELMEEVESYQRIRKYKKQEQESVKQDERFVEPDVDLPDLESVSSEEDQLNVKQCQELKVQSATKNKSHGKISSMKYIRQQQSKHVDWRKKRIMEKRRRQRDRESSSLSGNEKGHRWSSSSTAESETESDELSSSKTYKRTCKHLSSLHPSKNLQMMNLSDVVEAVTASSEESDDEEVGTSDIIHRPTVHVKKNESTQSLQTPLFITSPEKLSGDSPLPCVIQSNPPAENLRPSFERRLENLFRSSSMQPSTIETHEKERLNDAVNISVPSVSALDVPFFPSNAATNAVMQKKVPSSKAFFVERNSAEATVGKCPSHLNSTESWANSQLVANSIRHDAISDPVSFEIGVSSLVNAINEDKEENKHLDKIMEEHELIKDQEIKIGCELKEKEERKELEEQILEKKKAARENYVHAVYVAVREDLKNVLLKDLMRKIESVAFEKLEQGWKERNKAKIVEQDDDSWQNDIKDSATDIPMLTIDKPCIPLVEQTVSSKDSLNEMVRRVTEQTKAEMSAAFGPDTVALLGTGLFFKGLGIARNMPSFKKKQAHSSPRRKQRSRSSSCRSFCSAYSRTRSDRTPESNRSYERSESQHRSESSLPGRRSSDDEEAKSENERSTNGSESTCSTDRSSRTLSIRKHFSSGTFTQTDGSTSEEDEDEEEEVDEEEEEQEHVEKDFDELCAANKLSACSEFEEKPVLFVKTKTGACGGIESLSNRTATSYLIEHDKITEELRARNNKVLGIANIEGYFNDHCYLPVELSEQLKKEFEENVSACSDSETTSLELYETKKLGKSKETLLQQHLQDKTAKIKKRCYRNELASLLPPPVNVEQLTWESSWKSTKQWEKRTHKEEKEIFWKFEKEGLDAEDLMFLEKAFHEMQNDGTATWNRKLYWIPPRKVPIVHLLDKPKKIGKNIYYYDDLELEGVVPHSSGCARTEGYYKLSHKEKRGVLRRPDVFLTEISEKDDEKARYLMQSTREARSMNRRLLTSMGDTSSDIFKVNQLKFRKKLIKFARSRIHGWGLYALEAIAPDEMIVEYIGQKIRPTVADEREKRYERRGMGSSYLFRIDSDNVIDATQMGNLARFINHSCQPNCYAKIVVVDGEKRIVIYSKLPISKGDEITYDYKFPIEEDKIDCLCGAPGCRGSLN
ncbi:Histone-lysine N-methyltransferase set-2 [Dirofilaria immitis]